MPDVPTLRDTRKLYKYARKNSSGTTNSELNHKRKHRFYDSAKWKGLRLVYLMSHPTDELAALDPENRKVVPAETVHHVIKFDAQPTEVLKWRLFLDPENLLALSTEKHVQLHYRWDSLSGEEKAKLSEIKERLYEKYLGQGYIINVPSDSNF